MEAFPRDISKADLHVHIEVRAPELLNSTKDQLVLSYNNKQLDS
jgi:hypothetical protein